MSSGQATNVINAMVFNIVFNCDCSIRVNDLHRNLVVDIGFHGPLIHKNFHLIR